MNSDMFGANLTSIHESVDSRGDPMSHPTDLKVFISSRHATCDECGGALWRRAWMTSSADKRALCLACADLDHLIFLPSGDAALTRRAQKYSTLSVLVWQWIRARKRYERQGLLVDEPALVQVKTECLADHDVRACRQERAQPMRQR